MNVYTLQNRFRRGAVCLSREAKIHVHSLLTYTNESYRISSVVCRGESRGHLVDQHLRAVGNSDIGGQNYVPVSPPTSLVQHIRTRMLNSGVHVGDSEIRRK